MQWDIKQNPKIPKAGVGGKGEHDRTTIHKQQQKYVTAEGRLTWKKFSVGDG